MRKLVVLAVMAMVILAATNITVLAQEEEKAESAFVVYIAKPKAGMDTQFRAALKAHGDWRKENGETWNWYIMRGLSGKYTNTYVIRSNRTSWAGFDDYVFAGGTDHFSSTVAPLIGEIKAMYGEVNSKFVRPMPDSKELGLVHVSRMHLKQGKQKEFWGAIAKFHEAITNEDIPVYYLFETFAAGANQNDVYLIMFNKSFACLADPDPSVWDAMVKTFGEEEATKISEQFSGSFYPDGIDLFAFDTELSVMVK